MKTECCPPFALTRPAFPEMTSVAVPFASRSCGTVVMRFDAGDPFNLNDHPKTWNLPDSAVALLHRAGEWTARTAHYGFVPADMLARFSSDPVQAVEELLRRGLWRRVKGGYQFAEWELLGETAGQAAQREADADAERNVKSAGGRLGNHERWHVQKGKTAPGCEFCEAPSAPVAETDIAGAIGVRSGATPINRSDQGPSIRAKKKSRSRSKSDARASDADDPELVAAVASAMCAEIPFLPEDGQVRAVIRIFEERARKAGTSIRSKIAYYTTSVRNEPDLWRHILTDLPPLAEPEPAALPAPGGRDPGWHQFESPGADGVCWCRSTRKSPKHYPDLAESQCLA